MFYITIISVENKRVLPSLYALCSLQTDFPSFRPGHYAFSRCRRYNKQGLEILHGVDVPTVRRVKSLFTIFPCVSCHHPCLFPATYF